MLPKYCQGGLLECPRSLTASWLWTVNVVVQNIRSRVKMRVSAHKVTELGDKVTERDDQPSFFTSASGNCKPKWQVRLWNSMLVLAPVEAASTTVHLGYFPTQDASNIYDWLLKIYFFEPYIHAWRSTLRISGRKPSERVVALRSQKEKSVLVLIHSFYVLGTINQSAFIIASSSWRKEKGHLNFRFFFFNFCRTKRKRKNNLRSQ